MRPDPITTAAASDAPGLSKTQQPIKTRTAPSPLPKELDPLALAVDFLDAVKAEDAQHVAALIQALAELDAEGLSNSLNTDARKKAFWINIYNGHAQWAMLQKPPGTSLWTSLCFFRSKRFAVAGERLSLDQVEHGFLRRSRIWWAAGYLRKAWTSPIERRWRVDTLDPPHPFCTELRSGILPTHPALRGTAHRCAA